MSKGPKLGRVMVLILVVGALFAAAQDKQSPNLDQQFQSALTQYHAGNFPAAAAQLETLLPRLPKNYQVHELLGLVYAAQSKDAQAVEQFGIAVRLQPESAAAHTNFAAALDHTGKPELAAEQLRKALQLEPNDFDANHNLAELDIQSGKITDAIPLLEQAHRINPGSYNNGYDLALAYFLTGKLSQASQLAQIMVRQKDTGELHNLLAQIEEKNGQFVEAVKQYETAAHMDPSEQNLFDWGSEYLLHRTYDPAIEVFQKATELYPASPRLKIGLGMALYSRGKYDDAIKVLLAAADLDPTDPRCYLFLSKAYDSSPNQADEVIEKFRRFAELQPRNALAQYYYAMSLWKEKRADPNFDLGQVEALLQRSLTLDEKLVEAHVQLGNLYADQHRYDQSIPQYLRALQLSPILPDAHYRLGQDYVHTGQKDRAQAEFAIYQTQRAQHMAELDKERAEVRQFVYSAKSTPTNKP